MGAHLNIDDLKELENSINPENFRKIMIFLTILFMFMFLKLNYFI